MRVKFISLNSLLLLFTLFAGCLPKEKFTWDAGLSGPKHYPSGAPFVSYFYRGEDLAGASTGTGADQGWGITSGGFSGGDDFKPVPDSVYVKWVCSADDLLYKAGFKLPREKMLQLFKKGATDPFGRQIDYTVIVAGMAPGGNVCVWMQAGTVLTEVAKFKVNKGVEDPRIDKSYREKDIKGWGNYLTYWKLHGIPYHVWKVGEKVYNYNVGFSSEEDKNYSIGITGYSKDGTAMGYDKGENTLVTLKHKANYTPSSAKIKNKLPVHFYIQWISRDDAHWYEAEIVLPNNFSEIFTAKDAVGSYSYDRILIEMDKEVPGQGYVFGKVLIQGKDNKDMIMKFRAPKLDNKTRKYGFSKYSLPKGYIFPKWLGRNNLTFPKLDYWQEQ